MERPDIDKIMEKKWMIFLLCGVLILLVVVVWFCSGHLDQDVSGAELFVSDDEMIGDDVLSGTSDSCEIYVDISGAVDKPGVYCISVGEILDNVIELAGGLKDDVCSRWVGRELNLAAVVEPNSKIYIPFADDSECFLSVTGSEENNSSVADLDVGKVSINNASMSELESLSGVGPATAQKIIDGRPYGKLEDLMNVKGIGQSTYDKLKGGICL